MTYIIIIQRVVAFHNRYRATYIIHSYQHNLPVSGLSPGLHSATIQYQSLMLAQSSTRDLGDFTGVEGQSGKIMCQEGKPDTVRAIYF